jgi:tetratricopeptide (TPR) repeat protein
MAEGDRSANHPSPAQLSRFLSGEMSGREAAPIVAHLLTGCQLCREQMEPLAAVVFARGLPPEPPASDGTEYDFPIFRAFATARRFAEALTRERGDGREEKPLREVPPPPPLSRHERALRDELRCHTLLERSRSLRQSDPEGMVLNASLAVALAEQIPPGQTLSRPALADLQARSWAELGNARRVADDLAGSEAALARAVEHAGQGTGDPRLLALLMDLTASLYVDQRRFGEAVQLLDCTHALYRSLGQPHQAGRTLISRGIATGYALDSEEAVRLIGQGLGLIDSERDPKLALAGVHSVLYFLVESGRLAEARDLLELGRPLYAAQGGPLDQLKARWLEGLIAAGLGDDASAERALSEARIGFANAELPYDAALASLALAEIWLRGGRTRKIKELVDEMLAVFRARKIRREAIAALLMLREALEQEGATVALLRSVASELTRLEREPARRC